MENNQKEKNIIHNLSRHILYGVWVDMKRRCFNPDRKEYKNYGGRGITVCNEWLNIANFINDMFPSFTKGLTLDRINNNGNYEISNCRWVNRNTQMRNTRILRINNTSGFRGVTLGQNGKKWRARITIKNKIKHLGYFDTPINAAKAYDKYIIDNNLEHTRNF